MTPEMAAEIRAEAEKGDAESQSRLGDLYRFGARHGEARALL